MESILYEERFASHPEYIKMYNTNQLRNEFLIDKIFEKDKIILTYSAYDRLIIGGAMPLNKTLSLDAIEPLKAQYFCDRREVGIINVGGKGSVIIDNDTYELSNKEAIYIGKGTHLIKLGSDISSSPALFYINSAPAHMEYPTKKVSIKESNVVSLGKPEEANVRQIFKLIIGSVVKTCQLQMGLTELKTGSVWNTFPPHIHNRRMECYFYFNVPAGQAVCHFMGQPDETRHIWMSNNQAVISPPWSIHAAAGTSNYSFIWGMAGENMDYSDMDAAPVNKLR
jgi:4-deoxy-L-threo-5-hexosulose-uronate ketol-isomerase